MHKLLLGTAMSIALASASPASALDTVFCTNCSTTTQQLAMYARQLLQLQQEITIAQNAIANTLALPSSLFQNASGDVQRILLIGNQANMLNGETRAMLTRLAGTTGYPAGSLSGWQNRLNDQDVAISRAMYTAGKLLDEQRTSLGTSASNLDGLHSQALGTAGQQQTLQTIAGIEATIGQEIQKQSITTAGALQAMLTYQTAQADRDAYTRKVATAQELAGIKASCGAAAATGYPTVAACQSTGTTSAPAK